MRICRAPAGPYSRVGQLLQGPAVAVRVLEGGVQDPPEILDLADVHPAVGELGARRVDVRDDQVQALDGARRRVDDPGPYCDRAGRAGRRQLHDPKVVPGTVVEVLIEPGLLGVEGLRAVYVGDGYRDQLELPIHGTPSFRVVVPSRQMLGEAVERARQPGLSRVAHLVDRLDRGVE